MGTALTPPPLQELPAVKMEPVPYTPPQTEQTQPWQGFAGKTGQIANIADKFLQGWMAGKHTSEMKQRQSAADQIGNTRAAVDVAAATIANLQRQGKKEGDPDFDQAKKALSGSWNAYITTAQQFVTPPDDQKKSLGQRIKAGLVPQGPHLFQSAAIDALKQVDPMSLVPAVSPQEKEAQTRAAGAQVELDTRKKVAALQDQYSQVTSELAAAQKSGKSEAEIKAIRADQESISTQLSGYGTHVPKAPIPGQSDLEIGSVEEQRKLQAARNAGMKALQGGAKIESLPQDQQLAVMGKIPEDTRAIYLREVKSPENPNGRFATQLDAVQAMQRDTQKYYPRGYWTPLEEIKRNVADTLGHDLQDPNIAKQYGLPAPLRQGEDAPDWIVSKVANQEYERRNRSGAEPKVDWQQAKIWRTGVLDEAKTTNPDYADFVQTLDSGGQKYNIFTPPKSRPIMGHMPFTDTDQDRAKKYDEFRKDVLNRALMQGTQKQVYDQFPELRDLMGAGAGQSGQPQGSGPGGSALAPPPNAPVGAPKGSRNIRVIAPNGEQRVYRNVSDEQAEEMFKKATQGSGWGVEDLDIAQDDDVKPSPGKK